MTIKNPRTVEKALLNKGQVESMFYPHIYSFEGGFGLFTQGQYIDVYESPYVTDPICLMYDGELTPEGEEFLARLNP